MQFVGPRLYKIQTCVSVFVARGWGRSGLTIFSNDAATTEIYPLSLHIALPVVDHPGGDMHRRVCEADRPFIVLFDYLGTDSTPPLLQW